MGSADPVSLAEVLATLETLDLPALRVQFRNHTGRIAPTRIARPLLLRILAYRMQVAVHGDLRPETRRMLVRIADGGKAAAGDGEAASPAPRVPAGVRARPQRGTMLVREWQGRLERVGVAQDGYDWNGDRYPSLSAVAQAITGTKWNGPRFFGLDRPAKSGAKP